MPKTASLHPPAHDTPLYCLDTFSAKAKENAFYIETLKHHLHTHAFVSKAHRHDFYMLLYITKGGGAHTIDFTDYPVKPGSIFLMTPGQVHAWQLAPGTDGFIIFFVPGFYRMAPDDKNLTEFSFFRALSPRPLINIPHDEEKMVSTIIHDMYKEFNLPATNGLRLLRSYLDIVLLKLSRYSTSENNDDSAVTVTARLRKLEALIDRHYVKHKQPSAYADLMHLSASYLNSICKQMLGKTLSGLIHERVVLEAKRLFAYSGLTVNQVSARLGFSSSSYFIRFFKKHTGVTPEQFKETLNGAI